ncbi:MAG: hypothetical protein LBQ06_04995 [Frankiaceae bacterium]|nr:hypothetical protein [Frankiaceae bacterium]
MNDAQMTIRWLDAPEEHDYPAAAAYLGLLADDPLVAALVAGLQAAPTIHRKAKDLLRASGLSLLDESNKHVAADLHKVARGRALSPILLVRGDLRSGAALVIADGYHRVCASYHLDENTDIPCRLVGLPAAIQTARTPAAAAPPPPMEDAGPGLSPTGASVPEAAAPGDAPR